MEMVVHLTCRMPFEVSEVSEVSHSGDRSTCIEDIHSSLMQVAHGTDRIGLRLFLPAPRQWSTCET